MMHLFVQKDATRKKTVRSLLSIRAISPKAFGKNLSAICAGCGKNTLYVRKRTGNSQRLPRFNKGEVASKPKVRIFRTGTEDV